MRIWIKFSKEEQLKYLSHLDLMRVWQRALRRARLPVAYSEGFNPQMRLSFASALPVGATSGAEYADLIFSRSISPDELDLLGRELPGGLQILAVRPVPAPVPSLMSLVGAARWSAPLNPAANIPAALQGLLDSVALPVSREGKKGKKTVDLRPLILQLNLVPDGGGVHLDMLLATGGKGGARPGEVLALLGQPAADLRRTALLLQVGETLQSPLEVVFTKNEVLTDAKKDSYKL